MRVAVTIGLYNEAKHVEDLVLALLAQTHKIDEIIFVDDGSTDATGEIIQRYIPDHPQIQYLKQANQGPAVARNKAWHLATAEICVLTDGDCLPVPDWIETLLKKFTSDEIGAVAGTYRTLNRESVLARFIGLEIAWKYRNVRGPVDVHGAYNLAVRRSVLEALGGFREDYPMPSGEDWDLTYRISRGYKLIFTPDAVVGHYHPEKFWSYMRNQMRRGYDRIKVYRDHPCKIGTDTYTGKIVKYQVLAAAAFVPALVFAFPVFPFSWLAPFGIFSFLIGSSFIPVPYFFKNKDAEAAFYGVVIQFFRYFAWAAGGLIGVRDFIFKGPCNKF